MDKNDIVYVVDSCVICRYPLRLTWTDSHGEGVCLTCGTPYQIFQYGENGRIDKSLPMLAIRADLIPAMQEYWRAYGRGMGLGTYMTFHPRHDDEEAFFDWLEQSEWAYMLEEE